MYARLRGDTVHQTGVEPRMKVTVDIDDGLLGEARRLSGIESTATLVRAGLEALVARTVAMRLAALGGTQRRLRRIRRRRG